MCCCSICQEWERRKQAEAEAGKRIGASVNEWGGSDPRLKALVDDLLVASGERSDFESKNYRTLSDHQFLGISVTEQGIVVREPPLPGTAFHHEWVPFETTTREGGTMYARQCRNCGITYFKVAGDPDSDDDWVKGVPTS
jgi:hypothetical protein